MFVNLTNIAFSTRTLEAYKFRLLVQSSDLRAQDLAEDNDEYEGYRTFLYSRVKDKVLFIVVNMMTGDVPHIFELSNSEDRELDFCETMQVLTNIAMSAKKKGKKLDTSISYGHQEVIRQGVEDAVRLAISSHKVENSACHYEDSLVSSEGDLQKYADIVKMAAYNIGSSAK